MPPNSNYVWRYGVQRHRVDGRLGESCSVGRRGKPCSRPGAASRVAVCELPFGRRPYAGSRVQLTEGRRMHISGRGDVLSSRVPTAPGMVLQRPGWRHSGGDGCRWLTVMEETRSNGPMSQRRPVWARGR
jgi:hypothetical protein